MLDPRAGPVSGDPDRLQQVVWNLLTNAIKFTPTGGTVEILLERVDSHVEISVADTGIGIKPEFLPHRVRAVPPGRRLAPPASTAGSGSGSRSSSSWCELHGGTVRASSAGEGQGATFVVRLPLDRSRCADRGRSPDAAPSDRPRRTSSCRICPA